MTHRGLLLYLVLLLMAGALAWATDVAPVALAAKWAGGQFVGEEAIEELILAATNAERAACKLAPLTTHDALRVAARQHSAEMGAKGYFAHESPCADWRKAWQRAYYAGYWGQRIGENIILLQNERLKTPEDIARRMVELWMGSPRHRDNILKPEWTLLGIGVTKVGQTYYGTQVFGAPMVELQDAALRPVAGEKICLTLEGSLSRGKITVWLDNQLEQTVTPVRGKWSAEIGCPRGSGSYAVMVGANNILAWSALIDPNDQEQPVRAVAAERPGVVRGYSVTSAPLAGLRLTARARVPAAKRILLVRDRVALGTLKPDAQGVVTIDLLLHHREKPYTISIAVDDQVEDLLFVDATRPAAEAFLGRPE